MTSLLAREMLSAVGGPAPIFLGMEAGEPTTEARFHRARRGRRFRRSALLVIVVVAAAWFAINAYGCWYIARNQASHHPQPTPATVGLDYQDVHYAPGLSAWYIPASPARPVIVIVHGSGSNRSSPLTEAKGLHRRGYPLLLIELAYADGHRPYGGGQRETTEIRQAITYANQTTGQPVVLLGYSLGGFDVAAAAAKGVNAAAVITDSGFVSFQTNAADHSPLPRQVFSLMAPLYPLFSDGGHLVDVAQAAPAGYHLPTLVIQGTKDAMIAVHQARDLARILHGELWLVPGVGHTATYAVMPTAYLDHVDAFINAATRLTTVGADRPKP